MSRAVCAIFIAAGVEGEAGEIHERPIGAGVSPGLAGHIVHAPRIARRPAGRGARVVRPPTGGWLISAAGSDLSRSLDPSPELQKCVEAVAAAVLAESR